MWPIQWRWFHVERWCLSRVIFVGGLTLLHTNFHRKTNQNRSAQRQPISSLEELLESPFTRLSYGEGFKSQLEAVSEIQLIL